MDMRNICGQSMSVGTSVKSACAVSGKASQRYIITSRKGFAVKTEFCSVWCFESRRMILSASEVGWSQMVAGQKL